MRETTDWTGISLRSAKTDLVRRKEQLDGPDGPDGAAEILTQWMFRNADSLGLDTGPDGIIGYGGQLNSGPYQVMFITLKDTGLSLIVAQEAALDMATDFDHYGTRHEGQVAYVFAANPDAVAETLDLT